MKLAVVGTGMIVDLLGAHLNEWGATVAAIVGTPNTMDRVNELVEAIGAPGCQGFAAYADMLAQTTAEQIDTVYIAVPNFLHFSFAKQALEAGRSVIVEKPMCSNSREAEELSILARVRKLFFFEAISTLYQPTYLKIRELVARVGDVKLVSVNYSQYSHRYDAFREGTVLPAFDPAKSGGALMDLGLYCLQWITGIFGEPKDVRYVANVERGIDTSGVTTLDYGSFKAVSVAAKDCAAPCQTLIEGTAGYILQTTPPNNCGPVELHLLDGTVESYDLNPALQWESEFRAFARMMEAGDLEGCYKMLDQSLLVSRVQTQARLGAGVVFPADKA